MRNESAFNFSYISKMNKKSGLKCKTNINSSSTNKMETNNATTDENLLSEIK